VVKMMNCSKAAGLLPQGWPHTVRSSAERKEVAEIIIAEVLNQIESESREPIKWECDALSNAMGAVQFGSYVLAVNNAMECFLSKDEVAKPVEWWAESEEQTIRSLRGKLEAIKGFPPRFV
jgi:hypothetical protein